MSRGAKAFDIGGQLIDCLTDKREASALARRRIFVGLRVRGCDADGQGQDLALFQGRLGSGTHAILPRDTQPRGLSRQAAPGCEDRWG